MFLVNNLIFVLLTFTVLIGTVFPLIVEAVNGAEALATVDAGARPDIVLCDLDLPGVDGPAFLRSLAQRGVTADVVIVSGLEGERLAAAEREARSAGVRIRGTIAKPLTARRLLAVLA